MNFLNIDFIKTVSLMYIIPQIIYYGYMYNISVKQHIKENKEMLLLIKDIHKIVNTSVSS